MNNRLIGAFNPMTQVTTLPLVLVLYYPLITTGPTHPLNLSHSLSPHPHTLSLLLCCVDTAMRSLADNWGATHCLPEFSILLKTMDDNSFEDSINLWLHLHHNDFDFIYDPGPNLEKKKNEFRFDMVGHGQTDDDGNILEPDRGKVNYDLQAWRIQPKLLDGSSLGRDEVETGKEIDVMVSIFYDATKGGEGCVETKGDRIGRPKLFKCLVAPGLPESMELVVPGNNDGDDTITVTNGSSLEGKGMMRNKLCLPNPSTNPPYQPTI